MLTPHLGSSPSGYAEVRGENEDEGPGAGWPVYAHMHGVFLYLFDCEPVGGRAKPWSSLCSWFLAQGLSEGIVREKRDVPGRETIPSAQQNEERELALVATE